MDTNTVDIRKLSNDQLRDLALRYMELHIGYRDSYRIYKSFTKNGVNYKGAFLVYTEEHRETALGELKKYIYYVDLTNYRTVGIRQGKVWVY